MHVFLDIETIPCQQPDIVEQIAVEVKPPANMKKAETIAEWEKTDKPQAVLDAVKKTALDGAYGQIVCIGYAFDDGSITKLSGNDEKTLLTVFFNDLDSAYSESKGSGRPVFVGHNLNAFDLRFIFHRAVINNVKPPACFPINPKSWAEEVFDTMTYWAGYGNRISLDKLSKALGLPGKYTDFTWEDVFPAYKRGDFISIGEYCGLDVELTRNVYKRLTFNA